MQRLGLGRAPLAALMTTALTGSAGWSGLHPVQLGGPPLIQSWSRPRAVTAGPLGAAALPLLAHAYLNDGVTPAAVATFPILGRPSIVATTANGGLDQITLEVAAPIAGLTQGNVIRLTEVGGPWAGFVWGGIVESFPDTRSADGTKHQIVAAPFGWELTRTAVQLLYASPTDIADTIRAAVSATLHCSCDQLSVPTTTGVYLAVTDNVDFRGQQASQVLDTARSMAGPTWYWWVDELGRVWFQPQGSAPNYTLMGGQHYAERVTNGGDIADRKNQVTVVGGIPDGASANAALTANGSSQSSIGLRALDPPVQAPGVTDQSTLTAIATGILATLDQVWTRVSLKALPSYAQRLHQSQPGGAMVRYWEPAVNALPESAAGSGAYTGPFILQRLEDDGLVQAIEAGNIPVTNQTDIDNMVKTWANRSAALAVNIPSAPLNQPVVVPAGGLIVNVPSSLGYSYRSLGTTSTSTSFVATSPSIAVTFTLTRQVSCFFLWSLQAKTAGGSGTFSYARLNLLLWAQGSVTSSVYTSENRKVDKASAGEALVGGWAFNGNGTVPALVPGTYTAQVEVAVDSGQTMTIDWGNLEVLRAGT